MQVNAGKLQILTAAAILVLISGGIAAYAQDQSASTANLPVNAAPVALAGADTNSTSTTDSTSTVTSTVTSTTTESSTLSSTSSTSTINANQTLCQPTTPAKVGRLVLPITATGASASAGSSISFSNTRGCVASITTVGGIFNVQIELRYAKAVTQYDVVLVANGTDYTLGNMVTGPQGTGSMDNQVLLTTGTWVVSLQIYDVSSNPGHSTLVLQTGQGTVASPQFPTASSQQPSQGNQGHSGQDK